MLAFGKSLNLPYRQTFYIDLGKTQGEIWPILRGSRTPVREGAVPRVSHQSEAMNGRAVGLRAGVPLAFRLAHARLLSLLS